MCLFFQKCVFSQKTKTKKHKKHKTNTTNKTKQQTNKQTNKREDQFAQGDHENP